MSVAANAIMPGTRHRVRSGQGATVTALGAETSEVTHLLPPDAFVVVAEAPVVRDDAQRVRIASPHGWLKASDIEPAGPAKSLKLDYETFKTCHEDIAPGDHYGLKFPISLLLLREFGPEFLTAAFRASGAISEDNEVTEIVELKPLGIMGASENAFLTVAYARSEPGLQTELFVKFPPEGVDYKYALTVMSQGEVEFLRLSQTVALPMPVAKYYYCDYCSSTSNYILITERIAFGVPPIEPAYRKGRDHLVPDIEGHYRVLAKSLAKLVAAHKTGAMGYGLEASFPFPRAARDFNPIDNLEENIDRLIDFIARIAPHLFPAGAADVEFLKTWREDLIFGLTHKDAVIAYLHSDVDYTGLCHPNLNVDNAWYWRDAAGELQVGLLDWGGVGQMSIAQALSGMLMMPDPDLYLQLRQDAIATFVDECAASGGMRLDPAKLLFHYKASLYSTAICTIIGVVVNFLFRLPEEDYKPMVDRFDSRLQESGLSSAIIWIDNILREWLEPVTPGDVCRQIVGGSC